MKYPKPLRYENRDYRRYVASFPCFGCGVEGFSQACHRNGGGMGTKHSDLEIFPLCCVRPGIMGCHYQHDQCIDMTRAMRAELEDTYVRRMQDIARDAGRKEFE